MSNNTVDLNGYLIVAEVKQVVVGGQMLNQIGGWISTESVTFGGYHPFVATGKPADIILQHARDHPNEHWGARPNQQYGVTARGKLVSRPGCSFMDVKNINFFDTGNPVLGRADKFVVNDVKLQGHLSLDRQHPDLSISLGQYKVTGLNALLSTATIAMGGQHTVMIHGKLADEVLLTVSQHGYATLPATVGGKLLSLGNTIYIQAQYISLNHRRLSG